MRPAAAAAAAVITAAAAAGCGATVITLPPRQEAAAWMRAHTAPAAPGLVNAVVLPRGITVTGFAGPAASQACPGWRQDPAGVPVPDPAAVPAATARTAAVLVPAAGDLPGCGAWQLTALTAAGQLVTVTCGSVPGRAECPLWRSADGYVPGAGDYIRVRGGGPVRGPGDLQVIRLFADEKLLALEPDPGGPAWVTTRAGGA